MNNKRLKEVKEQEFQVEAICIHKTIKNFNPPIGKAGEVNKTPFQKLLKVKIGAKVILTYNVDTCDGLTNGARGELLGIIRDLKGNIVKMIVKFEKDSIGREKRRNYPDIQRKYPGGTSIEKINFSFSISKSKKTIINTANVIQFPLKLAFACTAHKVQGSTVPKPQKLIINTNDAFGPAMIYVMLSRVCALSQIFILDEFDSTKMFPNLRALAELKRLNSISQNENPTEWEKETAEALKIYSLNCRSLKKHYLDIISDDQLLKSDAILLQETWIDEDTPLENFLIPGFELQLNSKGRGKGLATYYRKNKFSHSEDTKREHFQMTKLTSASIDIISIYRSQNGNPFEVNKRIEDMMILGKPQLVIGDFNDSQSSSNPNKKYLEENEFESLIDEPTHIEGNVLDQAYLQDRDKKLTVTAGLQCKYYTDHKAIALIIKQTK